MERGVFRRSARGLFQGLEDDFPLQPEDGVLQARNSRESLPGCKSF